MKIVIFIFLILLHLHISNTTLEDEVSFEYYVDGNSTYVGNGASKDQLQDIGCNSSDKFAFIIHGWGESCQISWAIMLRDKLTTYRGGCIVCINYEKPASTTYLHLYLQFDSLVEIMTGKMKYLFDQGVKPSNTYLFGFSFGGQLVLAIGINFEETKIQEVDVCDAAGVGFDRKPYQNKRRAGYNVQCIHTSIVIGTSIYTCHQDWRMGFCGLSQRFETSRMHSHNYCPLFYISAFENPFSATPKPAICVSKNPAKEWPDEFRMGYTETRKSEVTGELFASTRKDYPYNVLQVRTSSARKHYIKLNYESVIIFIGFINYLILLI